MIALYGFVATGHWPPKPLLARAALFGFWTAGEGGDYRASRQSRLLARGWVGGLRGDTTPVSLRCPMPADYDGILALLREVDWHARVTARGRFERMMEASSLTAIVEEKGEIIGFGYAISDGVANGFITVLAVREKWRGRGIGTRLAQHLMAGDPQVTWILRTSEEVTPFWKRLGFERSQFALEKGRS